VIQSLSYIGFSSPNAQDWRTFGPDLLGFQLAADAPDGGVRLRLDDAQWRIAVHPGDINDLAYLGWSVSGPAALRTAIVRLNDAGVDVHHADEVLRADRCVAELIWFIDPVGWRHELSWGQAMRPASFRAGRAMSGFVTGEAGLGHVVMFAPDPALTEDFYVDVLGMRLSDQIYMGPIILRFFHCNPRHHTLALVNLPGLVGFHHLMVEVNSMDDVGTALDRVKAAGCSISEDIGRHTNDYMTSFYVRTPSGFDIEYGWGGRLIDSATWQSNTYDSNSIWGHHPGPNAEPPGIIRPFTPTEVPA
jgi:extradiol dioxygenase